MEKVTRRTRRGCRAGLKRRRRANVSFDAAVASAGADASVAEAAPRIHLHKHTGLEERLLTFPSLCWRKLSGVADLLSLSLPSEHAELLCWVPARLLSLFLSERCTPEVIWHYGFVCTASSLYASERLWLPLSAVDGVDANLVETALASPCLRVAARGSEFSTVAIKMCSTHRIVAAALPLPRIDIVEAEVVEMR